MNKQFPFLNLQLICLLHVLNFISTAFVQDVHLVKNHTVKHYDYLLTSIKCWDCKSVQAYNSLTMNWEGGINDG